MIRNLAAGMVGRGIALLASLLMRSAIKPLLQVDERSLLAVGLSRADVVDSLATPFATDPTELLASRAGRRAVTRDVDRSLRARMRREAGPEALACRQRPVTPAKI
ncbi:hypothetical protein [Bradyrhizobium sp.]|uniref:hypothetical protein n=1 Tax=Bradyrhizobium sp. TaxID=376 RepID=UPI0025B7AC28|nr:hypothetical protein [Bradyrhizobium sp.]